MKTHYHKGYGYLETLQNYAIRLRNNEMITEEQKKEFSYFIAHLENLKSKIVSKKEINELKKKKITLLIEKAEKELTNKS
jgi:hypothetical protein